MLQTLRNNLPSLVATTLFPFALVACSDDAGDNDANTASAAGGMEGKGTDASGGGGANWGSGWQRGSHARSR